jgi:hypothetical protein
MYEDTSDTGFITEFEYQLPLIKVDIDEFERRLKKLAIDDTITESQLIESFQDHPYLKTITEKDSFMRNLLLHEFFIHDK